ncbi:MAG: dihydroorotate dehydrogenase-like protein [Candidatus Pelagadaptatus aseana]|uniref:dihydroorotate dehydrogenase-like protein n=1 Tax=Candidatus Pelagadaptatus aseana TaxID=3120508 RepID=UPI0039B3492E
MVDLSTTYLGLQLDNPLVPSSSPLTKELDTAKRLEDAGASALVTHSLFEEKIREEDERLMRFMHNQEIGSPEADTFRALPDDYMTYQEKYLEHLLKLKSSLNIPIIASMNGTTRGGWVDSCKELEQAGADALELNIYYVAADAQENAGQVEQRYVDILQAIKAQVNLPVTMKLSSQFSAPLALVRQLEEAGCDGVALFNRFYQPDIDLETLEVVPRLQLSTPEESLLRIRWAALLSGRVSCSLAVTGGIHSRTEVIKALLAGADVTHMCSALLMKGPDYLRQVLQELQQWLEEFEYESVAQLKGSVSQSKAIDPAAYERANYVNVLDSYTPPPGVRW